MTHAFISVRRRFATCALLCLFLAANRTHVRADEPAALPDPGDLHSHELYAKMLAESRAAAFRKILAVYDRHLDANRDDYVAALGRCRFLASVRASGEYGEAEWLADEAGDCSAQLCDRFPSIIPILQFRLEQLAPEQAIAFAETTVGKRSVSWNVVQRARFLKTLALDYLAVGKTAHAIWAARTARSLDPSLDVALILATDLSKGGARREAVAELVRSGIGDKDTGPQKVKLLVELEAYREALKLIDGLSAVGVATQPFVHAQALAGAGMSEPAREKLREAGAAPGDREALLRRLFYLELAHGNRLRAIDAYQALRGQGFAADPLARDRIALAFAFPSAPWHARDMLGLLAFLGLCFALVLLPALVVLPIHYAALVRGVAAIESRWSLKQLWAVLASVGLAQLCTLYAVDGQLLADLLRAGTRAVVASHAPRGLGRALLFTALAGFIASAAWLRRGDQRWIVRCTASPRELTKLVFGSLAVVYAVQGASLLIAHALGTPVAATPPIALALTLEEGLRGVLREYGAAALFGLTVIVAPLFQEFVFRGVWLASTSRYVPFAVANLLQAVGFTLVHTGTARYPALFALALLAGWSARRAGGLAPALLLHAAVNLVATGALLIGANAVPHGTTPEPPASLAWQAAPQLERACTRGDADACRDLALRYQSGGSDVSKSPADAVRFDERACDAGLAPACYDLGHQYEAGTGAQPDFEAAATFYRKACELDKALGCSELAAFYEHGNGLPKNGAACVRLYKQACDRGRPAACRSLGIQYDRGNSVPFDATIAAHFYQRACDSDDLLACAILGSRYETGEGVERDLARAAAFYRTVCERGLTSGCYNLGRFRQFGIGVDRNLAEATRLYKISCEQKTDPACMALNHMTDAPVHAAPNRAQDVGEED